MTTHPTRQWLGVPAGLAAVLILLALPAPHRSQTGATPASSASRPASLGVVWPAARPFPLNATLSGGSTYRPALVVDDTTNVGVATTADGAQTSLVVNSGATSRVLQTQSLGAVSYNGVTVAGNRLFWIRSTATADGAAQSSLWSAATTGGPAAMLTADVGQPLFTGSQHDLVPANDRLYWISADGDRTDATQLRSVALTGGAVDIRTLAGAWQLTRWPWLVTAPSAPNTAPRFLNLQTAAATPISVPAHKLLTCDRAWCRLIPDDRIRHDGTDLVHPDGRDRQHIAGKDSTPIAGDPALLDRFEPLLTPISQTLAATSLFRLSLYDTSRRAQVQIDTAVTKAGAQGDYVWWATGDNETLTWHALDLRRLH